MTPKQSFGSEPNARHIGKIFFLENIGFSRDRCRSSSRKLATECDSLKEGEKKRPPQPIEK